MLFRHPSWIHEGALSGEECRRLRADAARLDSRPSRVHRGDADRSYRRSHSATLPRHGELAERFRWVHERVWEIVTNANARRWNWHLLRLEPLQITVYEAGEYYHWHSDQLPPGPGQAPDCDGLTRKLSVSIQLSGQDEYRGGELEIEALGAAPGRDQARIRRPGGPDGSVGPGTAVVFPSFLYHRVREVHSGTRVVLVGWALGMPFA